MDILGRVFVKRGNDRPFQVLDNGDILIPLPLSTESILLTLNAK